MMGNKERCIKRWTGNRYYLQKTFNKVTYFFGLYPTLNDAITARSAVETAIYNPNVPLTDINHIVTEPALKALTRIRSAA